METLIILQIITIALIISACVLFYKIAHVFFDMYEKTMKSNVDDIALMRENLRVICKVLSQMSIQTSIPEIDDGDNIGSFGTTKVINQQRYSRRHHPKKDKRTFNNATPKE